MNKNLVSCVIPTYKRSDTLTRAIDSVLKQTYNNVEVVVVDDNIPGSPESLEVKRVLSKYSQDARVRLIEQEEHINGAVARNVGIIAAQGVYVAFLDDDDEWLNNKLEKQIAFLDANKNVGGSSCLYSFYKKGQIVRQYQPYSSDDLQYKVLTRQVAIYTSTFVARKELLVKSGMFDPKLTRHQDLQLFVDFLSIANIEPVNECLVKIHIDSDMNRPNTDKFIKIKNEFFESVKEVLESYTKKEQRLIVNAHHFEVMFSAIQEKRFMLALKYILKIGIAPKSYIDVYKRMLSRKKEKKYTNN